MKTGLQATLMWIAWNQLATLSRVWDFRSLQNQKGLWSKQELSLGIIAHLCRRTSLLFPRRKYKSHYWTCIYCPLSFLWMYKRNSCKVYPTRSQTLRQQMKIILKEVFSHEEINVICQYIINTVDDAHSFHPVGDKVPVFQTLQLCFHIWISEEICRDTCINDYN